MDIDHEADVRLLEGLAAAKQTHAELKSLLEFYEALFKAQIAARNTLSPNVEVMAAAISHERLSAGKTQLTFEQLDVKTPEFVQLVHQLSRIIAQNELSWAATSQLTDSDTLYNMANLWFESGEPIIVNGQSTARSLAVGFALSAYLQEAASVLIPLMDLDDWYRNVCPICGGKPGFAVISREDGSRSLFCPRCHSVWPYRRTTCPFCESDRNVVYYASENQSYRLYVCEACKHYLKTIDLRRTDRDPVLPVERIITVGMDLAAQEKGYLHS